MSLLKKLAGETVIYGLAHVVGRLIGYLLVPYHTRVFDGMRDSFGTVGEFYAYIAMAMVIFTYRMETGFFRFGKNAEDRDAAFSTGFTLLSVTTPILILALVLNAGNLVDILELSNHPEWIMYLAFILGFDALSALPKAKLRLDGRPYKFALVSIVNILTNVFFNVFFLSICPYLLENGNEWIGTFFSPGNLVGYIFLANLLASATTFLILLPDIFKIKWSFDWELFRRLRIYCWPLVIVGFAGIINEVLDRALLTWLLPGTTTENRAVAGEYHATYRLAMMMTIFIQAFNYAAEPFFFKNADRKDSKVIYGKVGQAFSLVGSIVFLGMMMYMDVFVIFLGSDFRGAIMIAPILLLANLFLGLYYNFGIWFKLTDKTQYGMYIALIGAFITLIINIIGIPLYGYMASAWATLTCYAVMAVLAYLFGQKFYPILYPIQRMGLYVIASVGCWGISYFICQTIFPNQEILKWILNTTLFLGYLFVMYQVEKNGLIKAFTQKEKA